MRARRGPVLLALLALLAAPGAWAVPLVGTIHSLPLLAPTLLTDREAAYSIAVDSQGHVILGLANPTAVKVYDLKGNMLWKDELNSGIAPLVAVDSQDNVLIVRALAPVVIKYAPNGAKLWTTTLWPATATGLAADAVGNAYVASRGGGVGSVTKISPSGALVWTTEVGGSQEGLAVTPSGRVVVTGGITTGLDENGNVIWQQAIQGYDVALDGEGNAYAGDWTESDPLGFPTEGHLFKIAPNGRVAWMAPDPVGYLGLSDGQIVSVTVACSAILYYNPLPCERIYFIDAYEPSNGQWSWGFKHNTGAWGGTLFAAGRNGLSARPGYLAFTAEEMDSPVYSSWLLNACDNALPPLPVLSEETRACVFTPV